MSNNKNSNLQKVSYLLAILIMVPFFSFQWDSFLPNSGIDTGYPSDSITYPSPNDSAMNNITFSHLGDYHDGSSYKMVFHENYGYLANGFGGVEIFNLTDPQTPEKLSEWDPNLNVIDLAIYEHYLYAIVQEQGLVVFDISDPLEIVELCTFYSDFETLNQITIANSKAYVIYESNCIQILDLSDPTSFACINSYYAGVLIENLYIEDNILVFQEKRSLNFHFIGYNDSNLIRSIDIFNLETVSNASQILDFSISSDILYILGNDNLLYFVDIKNPEQILLNKTESVDPDGSNLCIYADKLYLHNRPSNEKSNIMVYNVSKMDHFDIIGQIEGIRSHSCQKILLHDGFLYAFHLSEGFSIYNVSNLISAHYMVSFDEDLSMIDCEIDFPYAYILSQTGLEIFDLFDVNHVQKIGCVFLPNSYQKLVFINNMVYIFNDTELKIFNVYDPSNPTEDFTLSFNGTIIALAASRFTLFLSITYENNQTNYLNIYDLQFWGNFTLRMAILHDTAISYIYVRANLVFCSDLNGALYLFEFTEETETPNLILFPSGQNFFQEISLIFVGSTLYMNNQYLGIQIYDLSNLDEIQLISQHYVYRLQSIYVYDDYIFTIGERQLQIIDALNISSLISIAKFNICEGVEFLCFNGRLMYSFSSNNGVSAYYLPDLEFNRHLEPPHEIPEVISIPGFPLAPIVFVIGISSLLVALLYHKRL